MGPGRRCLALEAWSQRIAAKHRKGCPDVAYLAFERAPRRALSV